MRRKRKPSTSIDTASLTRESWVSRKTLVAIVAGRLKTSRQTLREVKDAVGHRIAYAVKKGQLAQVNGLFNLGQAVRWMREKWPGKFDDLPVAKRTVEVQFQESLRCSDWMKTEVIYRNIDSCNAALQLANERIEVIEAENAALRQEVEALRPLAEKSNKRREINQKNASKRREGSCNP